MSDARVVSLSCISMHNHRRFASLDKPSCDYRGHSGTAEQLITRFGASLILQMFVFLDEPRSHVGLTALVTPLCGNMSDNHRPLKIEPIGSTYAHTSLHSFLSNMRRRERPIQYETTGEAYLI